MDAPGRGAESHRDRDRLVVVEHERRQVRPGGEAVPAVRARSRVDRIAQLAEAVDVAAQRPAAHLEPLRQLVARPELVRLEQREQAQRPGGRIRSRLPIFPDIAAGICPHWLVPSAG